MCVGAVATKDYDLVWEHMMTLDVGDRVCQRWRCCYRAPMLFAEFGFFQNWIYTMAIPV